MDDLLPSKILKAMRQGDSLKEITVAECTKQDGQVCYWGKRYVPENDHLQLRIMQEHHHTTLAGHPGRANTFDHLDRQFSWEDLQSQVDQYVWKCHNCQWSKPRGMQRLEFCVRYQYWRNNGKTFRWILQEGYPSVNGSMPSWWWSIGFENVSFHFLPYNNRCGMVGTVIPPRGGMTALTT
jgi:hypothetical protein